eukprot:jgi/Botrbrau1/3549/Bobra.0078s0006.1
MPFLNTDTSGQSDDHTLAGSLPYSYLGDSTPSSILRQFSMTENILRQGMAYSVAPYAGTQSVPPGPQQQRQKLLYQDIGYTHSNSESSDNHFRHNTFDGSVDEPYTLPPEEDVFLPMDCEYGRMPEYESTTFASLDEIFGQENEFMYKPGAVRTGTNENEFQAQPNEIGYLGGAVISPTANQSDQTPHKVAGVDESPRYYESTLQVRPGSHPQDSSCTQTPGCGSNYSSPEVIASNLQARGPADAIQQRQIMNRASWGGSEQHQDLSLPGNVLSSTRSLPAAFPPINPTKNKDRVFTNLSIHTNAGGSLPAAGNNGSLPHMPQDALGPPAGGFAAGQTFSTPGAPMGARQLAGGGRNPLPAQGQQSGAGRSFLLPVPIAPLPGLRALQAEDARSLSSLMEGSNGIAYAPSRTKYLAASADGQKLLRLSLDDVDKRLHESNRIKSSVQQIITLGDAIHQDFIHMVGNVPAMPVGAGGESRDLQVQLPPQHAIHPQSSIQPAHTPGGTEGRASACLPASPHGHLQAFIQQGHWSGASPQGAAPHFGLPPLHQHAPSGLPLAKLKGRLPSGPKSPALPVGPTTGSYAAADGPTFGVPTSAPLTGVLPNALLERQYPNLSPQ